VRIIITILIFLSSGLITYSDNVNNLDSLKDKLNSSTDEQKMFIYLEMARQTIGINNDEKLKYSEKSFELASQYRNSDVMIKSLCLIAKYQVTLGMIKEADANLDRAHKLALKNKSIYQQALVHFQYGNYYFNTGSLDKSINSYNKCINLSKSINNDFLINKSYSFLGSTYNLKTDFHKALDYFFKCLPYFQKSNNDLLVSELYNDIANSYANLGQLDKSLEYYNKSIIIKRNIGFSTSVELFNIAVIYLNKNESKKALDYFKQTYSEDIKSGNLRDQAISCINIGTALMDLGKLDSSYFYHKESLRLSQIIDDSIGMADAYQNLGTVEALRNRHGIAIEYFEKSIVINSKPGENRLDILADVYHAASLSWEKIGNHDKAMALHQLSDDTKMELNKKKNLLLIEEIKSNALAEHNIEILNKDKQIAKAQKDELITIAASSIILFIAALGFSFALFRLYKKIQVRNRELTELNAMQKRIYQVMINDMRNSIFPITTHLASLPDDDENMFVKESYKNFSKSYNKLVNDLSQNLN
jgi:tetratricopeptide (TPR) repeat protein